jgi:hypothetical protein
VSKGGVLPGLWPIHGDGVLARQGDLVLLIHPAGGAFADRLLDLLTNAARVGQDGLGFTSLVAAEFDADAAAADMADPGPSAVAFGPDGVGTAMALYGTAWADVTTVHGVQRLSPGQPHGRLRCVLPSEVVTVRAGVLEGDITADTDPYLRLADGVVRAVALAYAPEGTAAPSRRKRPEAVVTPAEPSVTPGPESVIPVQENAVPGPETPENVIPPGENLISASVTPGQEKVTPGPETPASVIPPGENLISESVTPGPESVTPGPESVTPGPENVSPPPENVAPAPENVIPPPENEAQEAPVGGGPQEGGFNWGFGQPSPSPSPGPGGAVPEGVPGPLSQGGPLPPESGGGQPQPGPLNWDFGQPSPSPLPQAGPPPPESVGQPQQAPLNWDFVSVQFGPGQPESEVPKRPPLPLGAQPPEEQSPGIAEQKAPEVLGVYCKNGHFDDPEARYCAVCGISMAQLTKAPRKGKRPPLGVLVLDDGSVFQLDADYVIGREPSLDSAVADGSARPLRLTDSEGLVSRIHARIELDGWQVYISDLESANGTYVQLPGEPDGQLLTPRVRTPLTAGTHVRVGRDHGFRYDSHRHR